jgi:hypothetical protein
VDLPRHLRRPRQETEELCLDRPSKAFERFQYWGPRGVGERDTDANMIVLSACRQTIGLAGEGFVMERARFFEEDGLEVTR